MAALLAIAVARMAQIVVKAGLTAERGVGSGRSSQLWVRHTRQWVQRKRVISKVIYLRHNESSGPFAFRGRMIRSWTCLERVQNLPRSRASVAEP
jgi:hypothetical protein